MWHAQAREGDGADAASLGPPSASITLQVQDAAAAVGGCGSGAIVVRPIHVHGWGGWSCGREGLGFGALSKEGGRDGVRKARWLEVGGDGTAAMGGGIRRCVVATVEWIWGKGRRRG